MNKHIKGFAAALSCIVMFMFFLADSAVSEAYGENNSFESAPLFFYDTEVFVDTYNKLSKYSDDEKLEPPRGQVHVTDIAFSKTLMFEFNANNTFNEINSIVITADDADSLKQAVIRTVFLVDSQSIGEVSRAVKEILSEDGPEEAIVMDDTIILTRLKGEYKIKVQKMWQRGDF